MIKIAIQQSNYIPWKGYFDSINLVDIFVVYDEMQFTKRDWRNRNLIKTALGSKWLTIPVETSGKYFQKIKDTKIASKSWNKSHLESIKQSYKLAVFFKENWEWLENLFLTCDYTYLTDINLHFINEINAYLDINTEIRSSSEFRLCDDKNLRLIDICKSLNGTDYFSGPAARSYINRNLFEQNEIKLHFHNYNNYKTYEQIHGNFSHEVSIIDTILNIGKEGTKNQFIL